MSDDQSTPRGFDEVRIPFVFVRHGDPEPTEWMARHPGSVKFPATWVPRKRAAADAPASDPPVSTAPALATAPAVACLFESGSFGLGELLTAAALAFAAAGMVLYPSRAASTELGELPPDLRPKPDQGGAEALVPPPHSAAPPRLAVPAQETAKPGEPGITLAPPAQSLPGLTLPPPSTVLPGHLSKQPPSVPHQDRDKGGVRTGSERAREAGRDAGPAASQTVQAGEGRAYRLINLGVAAAGPMDLAPVPLLDDKGHAVLNPRGEPMMRPAGMDPHFFVAQGLKDRREEEALLGAGTEGSGAAALGYEIGALSHFDRGAAWDAQRLGGSYHPEFVDYATVAIGLYAAANGIPRSEILDIQNWRARDSHYARDKKMDKTYTHLPEDNVENTDLGYRLYQTGRIAAVPPGP